MARTLERIAFFFLVLMVLFAPVSIAATQTAWLIGMLAWVTRLFIRPSPKIGLGSLGTALLALFGWTLISSIFSYEPAVSLDKLRGVSVFLIFFFVLNNVRNVRAVHFLAFCLIGSCTLSAIWAPIHKFVGKGIEVRGVVPDSPLGKAGVLDGDVALLANGKRIGSPDELIAAIETAGAAEVEMVRGIDSRYNIRLRSEDLLAGRTANDRIGITSWARGTNFRAAGFYGHYATFAEVLLLIGSLAFGLFIAAFARGQMMRKALVFLSITGTMAFALLLTVTRASQLGFIISSLAVVLVAGGRRLLIAALAIAVPASLIGLYFLQQQRQVGFFDAKDGSIQYRLMMWRDGARLLAENPKHLIVGVGMDSLKKHWEEWGFYDKGWQPMGHFHSTPVQLVIERGIPALLIWLIVLAVYARSIWRGLRREGDLDLRSRGILLGCFGGLIGFFASGLVHYNLGDQEVAMVFYILMGLAIRIVESRPEEILLTESPILASAKA